MQKKNTRQSTYIKKYTGSLFLIVIVLLFYRCAYLNTFYNATVSFSKAFKIHSKLIESGADTTQLPHDISDGYNRTIKKCTKLMDVYPKRKKWHDDAQFLKGKATYYNKKYQVAIRRFKQFQKEYTKSPYIPESYLFLGKSYLGNENLQKAEETFLFVIEKYPNLNKNEEITLLLAEVAINREGKSEAIEILEKSLKSVKSDEKKMDITLKLSMLYYELKLYSKAIEILEKSPRNKDFQHYFFRLDFTMLLCYKELKKNKKALAFSEKMLKNKYYFTNIPEILLEKALILNTIGKTKEAVKVFEKITKETTASAEVQGRAWFELGLIYQSNGDFDEAKKCYEQVVSLIMDDDIRTEAEERIEGIDIKLVYIVEIEKIIKNDSGNIDTLQYLQYKLGEVFWLNLSEADSALAHFSMISNDSQVNKELAKKSIYAQAWIMRFMKNDTLTSDSIYHAIIKAYPASIIAKKAQQDLGIPVTVQTYEDSAQIAFIKAERYYFDQNDPKKAVNAFYRVSKKFSDLEELAAQSLYTAGWLCDNVLHKNKKALDLYRILCKKYPESGLCVEEAMPKITLVEDTLKIRDMEKKKKNSKRKKKNKKNEKEGGNQDSAENLELEDLIDEDISDSIAIDSVSEQNLSPAKNDTTSSRQSHPSSGQMNRGGPISNPGSYRRKRN